VLLDALEIGVEVAEVLPRGHSDFADQLRRALQGAYLQTCEGAARRGKDRIARLRAARAEAGDPPPDSKRLPCALAVEPAPSESARHPNAHAARDLPDLPPRRRAARMEVTSSSPRSVSRCDRTGAGGRREAIGADPQYTVLRLAHDDRASRSRSQGQDPGR